MSPATQPCALARSTRSFNGGSDGGTVLVHGAGSFGHHPASEYGVARGNLSDPRVRLGFTLTRSSVTRLNGLVTGELVAAGITAVGLSPLGLYTTCGRQVHNSGAAAVADCLRAGLVPVLHGDAVLDEQLGCTILSGDTLVRDLAERLRPQYVVFLTNVTGVYDRPPEEEGARLLRRIVVRKDGSWRVAEADGGGEVDVRMTADAHDVTGGIALKVEEAARVARLGVPVIIAKAGSEDGAAACRLGPQVADGTATSSAGLAASAVSEPGSRLGPLASCLRDGAEEEEGEEQKVAGECAAASQGPQSARTWRGTLVVLEDDECEDTGGTAQVPRVL
ncbi:hypothetical protein VOLCADRAFT_89200 [Volvox carteri f. nagariensis]|uniref:Isopentenyl phosphate kinase n=1 Tax=Volvox carteri f. nagariensis TaxID=3068 RepID=D8TR24_VOLCA|nr:uncharacterized protein VOLCADRAFT_89200 [Volvox carteri f. nagariensis]EFJ50261.1 hypothetical protein VOLCADRAFT_89200 [Volvox carteri f. nagariensis]|eukprot:XP_002948881.1 hypothetical protein VOLCADRAFT_89200 [Volvox carteri f. nagariensis]